MHQIEFIFYFLSFSIFIFYSFYCVYVAGQEHSNSLPRIIKGKDENDFEWKIMSGKFFPQFPPWLLIHLLGSKLLQGNVWSRPGWDSTRKFQAEVDSFWAEPTRVDVNSKASEPRLAHLAQIL